MQSQWLWEPCHSLTQTLSVLSVQKAVSTTQNKPPTMRLYGFAPFLPPRAQIRPVSIRPKAPEVSGPRQPGVRGPAARQQVWARGHAKTLPLAASCREKNANEGRTPRCVNPVPQLSPYTHSSPLVQLAWSRGYLLWSPPHLFGDGGKGKPTGKPKLILGDPPFDAHGSTYPNLVCSSANLGFDSIASQTRIWLCRLCTVYHRTK